MSYPNIGNITINTPQGPERFEQPEAWKYDADKGTVTITKQGRTRKYVRGQWQSITIEDPEQVN